MITLLWVSNVMPNVAEEVNLFSLSCLLRSLSCRLLLYRETDAIAAIPKFLKEIGNWTIYSIKFPLISINNKSSCIVITGVSEEAFWLECHMNRNVCWDI